MYPEHISNPIPAVPQIARTPLQRTPADTAYQIATALAALLLLVSVAIA
ncbi:MAG: hypothetical protein ACYC46_15130 [Acidobacteriaceae bacterium]